MTTVPPVERHVGPVPRNKTRNGTPGNPSKSSRSTRNEKRIKSPFLCRSVPPPSLEGAAGTAKAERKPVTTEGQEGKWSRANGRRCGR